MGALAKLFVVVVIMAIIVFYWPINVDKIPTSMQSTIEEIKSISSNDYDFAKRSFELISEKYTEKSNGLISNPKIFFLKDMGKIWSIEGYLPNNLQVQVYKSFLINSGLFSKDQVEVIQARCGYTVTSFVKIKKGNETIVADLWAYSQGYKFGEFAAGECRK